MHRDGPRLQWIGDALVRVVEIGGLELFRDLFLALLMNEEWQKANRSNFLIPNPTYLPLDRKSGPYKLLSEAGRSADWDLPYESLDISTLVITGLQDHVFLESEAVDDLFSRLPRGKRIDMPDSGHLIPDKVFRSLGHDYFHLFVFGNNQKLDITTSWCLRYPQFRPQEKTFNCSPN